MKDARGEVLRGALTFRTAGEEALRITGEWLPLDWNAANRGRSGIVRRYPIGPVAGISPFNFPLNLAAHKVAPAIAAGCSIVLKPPSVDPLIMLRIAEYIDETDLPKGAVSILPMDRPTGDRMVSDDRFKLLSFTGSPSVGWKMKAEAGKKKVVLELGGNAGAIVDETADLDWAVERLVYGAFAYAGQVCISVQRIYVVREVFDEFERRFVERTRGVKVGDPLDPATDLGPMVDDKAVARTHEWVQEALAAGPGPWPAGRRTAARIHPPSWWTCHAARGSAARRRSRRWSTSSRSTISTPPCARSTTRRFGLQCGLFTSSLERTLRAHDELEVGRRDRQRRPHLADRPDAVRRGEGLGARPRGAALEHRGHDRATPAGLRPSAVTATATRYARVLRTDELRDGELIPVEIDGTPVVLVRHAR